MYARVLRKWSLQKLLMFYLWLPVAMLLVICSHHNAASMHLSVNTNTAATAALAPSDNSMPDDDAIASYRYQHHHQQQKSSFNFNNNNNNNNNMRPQLPPPPPSTPTQLHHQYPYEVFINGNSPARTISASASTRNLNNNNVPHVPNSNSQIINLYNSLTRSSANLDDTIVSSRRNYYLNSNVRSMTRRQPPHRPVQKEVHPITTTTTTNSYPLRHQTPNIHSNSNDDGDDVIDDDVEYLPPPAPLHLALVDRTAAMNETAMIVDDFLAGRNRRDSRPFHMAAVASAPLIDFRDYAGSRRRLQQQQQRRYCSARDPAQLAFEAPTVFEGKIISMSYDRQSNFSVSFEVKEIFKKQIGYTLQKCVRLQFTNRNRSGQCDIYQEFLRPRGLVRGDKLEQKKLYVLFVQQIDSGNFTILGQPIRKTRRVVDSVRKGVSENYAQPASIKSLNASSKKVKIGEELRIVCRVRGQPPPKVTWFKDDKSINRNRTLYKFKFMHYKKRSELIITSFNSSDAGLYECRAKNKVIRRPEKRTIRIEAFPRIKYPPLQSEDDCKEGQHSYCLNGGTCKFFTEFQLFSCICPDGYNGDRCQEKQWNDMPPNPTFTTGYIADDPTVLDDFDEEDDDEESLMNDDDSSRKDTRSYYNKFI